VHPAIVPHGAFTRSHLLARRARSLDVLHVAAAHIARCDTFVSADDRQLAVAKASRLSILDIKRPIRSRTR